MISHNDISGTVGFERRLGDPSWDLRIAERVMAKRRRGVRMAVSSGAGALAAAVIGLFLLFGLSEPAGEGYETFVSRQVMGTYSGVFGTAAETGGKESGADLLLGSETDAMIEETLSMR